MAKEVPENLRKQLALAVRNIQWSYAIFWSPSATQPGVLEWREGYYNGDIKTRKTVPSVELNADELGLQRSDQLRELYGSLLIGETNPQSKRPTAALSPEDLTDAEWYFLVCMSFVFKIGQGLPGSTIAKNQTFWICNAHLADTKFFSRSLLAKSASIKTIVCFPHLEGVVELGTTELVPEDLNLIQHIKTTFLESYATVPKISSHVFNITSNNGFIPENQLLDCRDGGMCSQNTSSDDFVDNILIDDSNLVEGLNEEANWPVMDDAISNCRNISTNSSDCVSQTYGNGNSDTIVQHREGTKENDNFAHDETQECNQQKQNLGAQGDEIHYQSLLFNLLKSSQQLILGPYFRNGNRVSSFVRWKDGSSRSNVAKIGTSQKLLKKVLFGVAKMHEHSRLESGKRNGKKEGPSKPVVEEMDRNHVLSERKRREKMNERFMILGSLIPSGGKVDKVSILDHTIEYLRQLERKVEELQAHNEVMEMTQTKSQDETERISDNCCPNRTSKVKKPLPNKRKACNMDNNGAENSRARFNNSLTDNITVKITDRDVLIEMSCSWKECVLIEVMEAVKKLHLHSETVQSSNVDGVLSMTIKAKSKGLKVASASVIRQALHKIISSLEVCTHHLWI